MELPGVNPLGSMAAYTAEAPMRKLQQISRVTGSDGSGKSASDSRQHPEQDSTAAEARDIAALRREMQRRGLPAGPPPAFQITLLEAEGGLQQALARLEATRTQERDAPALRVELADAEVPLPERDQSTADAAADDPAARTDRTAPTTIAG